MGGMAAATVGAVKGMQADYEAAQERPPEEDDGLGFKHLGDYLLAVLLA